MLLYHPELDRTFETGNDSEEQAAVLAATGWRRTVPGEFVDNPALANEQADADVVYQPVLKNQAEPPKASATAKKANAPKNA